MDELTIAFKIESPPSWLPIGRTAENNWRTVEIDCSYWFNMSADGEVVLMYKPSCGMSPYPLLTEREGDNIIWRPKSGELVEGVGRLQAFFEVGTDVIGSSDMISCEVDSSLLGSDPGTDPGQTDLPWALDIIEQIAELSGHYPKIENGVLYVWDSEQEDWVQFQGGGSSTVIVTIDDTTDPMTASMTAAEIKAAVDRGERVVARYSDADVPYIGYVGNTSIFIALADFGDMVTTATIMVTANGLASINSTHLAAYDDIPTSREIAGLAPVQSVNGQTGAVTLTASDVNALPDSTVIPTVPTMATDPNMSDWTSGKTVDAATMKTGFSAALLALVDKADINDLPLPSDTNPNMDGTAAVGTSDAYARADHVHPSDTTRLAVNQGAANAGKFMVVGNDGNIAPVAMTAWQGGSY